MKTILRLMLITTVLLQISCDKENVNLNSRVHGVWVHTETETDTMDFNRKDFVSQKSFELRRGTELKDDKEIPKEGSGPYVYEIKGDSIYLNHVASSTGPRAYYFKMDTDKKSFTIGNFAPFTGGLMLNKFRRID